MSETIAAYDLAKRMIAASQSLCIPAEGREPRDYKGKPYIVRLTKHALNPESGRVHPDLIVAANDQAIAIEVCCLTPQVNAAKRARYAEIKLPCLQIDLSKHLHLAGDERLFRAAVLVEAPRSWVYHPLLEATND